jgi:hypothetical protein
MPLFIPWAWWAGIAASMVFVVVGIVFDVRRKGRVHPAWTFALVVILGGQAIADVIAYSDFGIEMTERLIAGTPGAERSMAAFFPG